TMAYPKISNGVRLTDGRLVTTEGKGVYLLDDGRKRPIPSPQVFKSHNFKFSNVQRIAKKDFEAIDNGDVLPLQSGTIAVSKADQKAYLIENGKKRYITGPDVVQKSLYSFEEAVMVKEEVLNQHPDGKDYTNHYYVANGTPIFAEETGMFLVKNNTKRPIPNRATYRSWFEWDELKEVSQEKMDELPTGDEIKPRDGTLLANDKTVYLVENGKKRAFSSVKEFRDGGFSFNNVMKVSNAVTSSLKEGKVMAEEIKNRVRGNQMSNLDVSGVSTPKRDFLGLTTVSKEKKNTIKYLNKSNGNSVWTYTHSNSNVDDVQYSPDGTLVYSRAASELVAHNRSSGTVQWKQNFNNNIKAMDGQEVSNAIYILTKANKIHKIDTKSGNIKWTREQSEFAGTSTDFDTVFSSKEVNRTFVSLKNKGGIYALNSKDGTLVWKKNWNKFDGASDIVLAPNGQDIYL
ncbi:MAG: PQQ-binding-like beta-propeller repeat protein, partial [Candidatus Paceibacteria bacterium]